MDAWTEHTRRSCHERFGVSTPRLAAADGIAPRTFRRRVAREGWSPSVGAARIAPYIERSVLSDVSAVLHVVRGAAVAGQAALWRHGIADRPRVAEIAIPHEARVPAGTPRSVWIRRRRWLGADDTVTVDRLATLRLSVACLTLGELGDRTLHAHLIDAEHAVPGTLQRMLTRLSIVGPVPGRHRLIQCGTALLGHRFESIFDAEVRGVLEELGYRPSAGPVAMDTPDGRGVTPDVVLPWGVVVEIQGDRYHSTRDARRADRRKLSQYAGLPVKVVLVDWHEWYRARSHVLAAIDAAILEQIRTGVASATDLPPHLMGRSARRPPSRA